MVNKILRVGDSAAITIPRSVLKEMGLSIGDKMVVTYLPNENEIVVKPLSTGATLVSDRVARLTAHFIDRYRGALKRLAR
jgi:antitoxin component of MazEF toxin-antitoxin module